LTARVFGVGPVIAGMVIGDIRQVSRFPGRDHFAADNGTAPAEVSSGNRKIYRLSRRGNRRLNFAIHMAAITQIRHKHSDGRAYDEKKIAEGKTHKEALRALKRRVSDAIYAALDPVGGLLGVAEFPVTPAGYARLLGWLGGFGTVCLAGIEGTGSYGAGLALHVAGAGV
jgi:transposase